MENVSILFFLLLFHNVYLNKHGQSLSKSFPPAQAAAAEKEITIIINANIVENQLLPLSLFTLNSYLRFLELRLCDFAQSSPRAAARSASAFPYICIQIYGRQIQNFAHLLAKKCALCAAAYIPGAVCLLVNALRDFISIPYLPAVQWNGNGIE